MVSKSPGSDGYPVYWFYYFRIK